MIVFSAAAAVLFKAFERISLKIDRQQEHENLIKSHPLKFTMHRVRQ